MDLHVVILNWNASADTIDCVCQLLLWRDLKPRVWIVDNASDGDDADAISEAIADQSSVTLICNKSNWGFSGGSNVGIRAALDEAQAPILLLNNDAILSEEVAQQLLVSLHVDHRNGVVGPLLFADAAHTKLVSAGSRDPVRHLHNQITEHRPEVGQTSIVDYISGSVALFRPELFEEVGLFDEDYFFSGEVADLCRRAKDQGFLCLVDGEAKAHHNLNRSSAQRGTIHTYYIVRNRFLYIRKFYKLSRPLLTAFWAMYGRLLAWKLRLFGNYPTAKIVEMATIDGLFGRFGGQNRRILAAAEAARPKASALGVRRV